MSALLLVPAFILIAAFLLWCLLTAEDSPDEPKPPPEWRGGWRA